ncbi:hypothetical protein V3C99_002958 [Haemonchus contortus]
MAVRSNSHRDWQGDFTDAMAGQIATDKDVQQLPERVSIPCSHTPSCMVTVAVASWLPSGLPLCCCAES